MPSPRGKRTQRGGSRRPAAATSTSRITFHAVDAPVRGSQPGEPSTHPDRPDVPARLDAPQKVIWDRVLRNQPSAAAMYRATTDHEPCNGCDRDCCSDVEVPVNVEDARRIARALGLPPRDFLALTTWHAQLPVHPIAWDASGSRALCLRHRDDGGCAFLLRLGAHRRCGIHALRPDACRLFPFVADAAAQSTVRAGSLLQLHPSHCPWRWPVTPERHAQVNADIADNRRHRALDRELLSTWSPGRKPTEDAFFRWFTDSLGA